MSAKPARLVALDAVLQRQGFGTRRGCRVMVHQGRVTVGGQPADDPDASFELEGLPYTVDGAEWVGHEQVYLMVHKPVGYEVSRKPQHHLSVHSLLPEPLNERGVQGAGRLDADTSGLLLMSDDGAFLHALTSPKSEVAKTYEVTLVHAADESLVDRLRSGVHLRDEDGPTRAHAVELVGPSQLRLVLTEGKYHQVKRMIAAAGNRVASLHRPMVGALALPPELGSGEWRYLTKPERGLLWLDPGDRPK